MLYKRWRKCILMMLAGLWLCPAITHAQQLYTNVAAGVQQEKWYRASIANQGDPTRFHEVMMKAEKGHPITVAVIGGSITAGARASHFNTTAYGPLMSAWWKTKFPNTPVTFVNAGIGATNSVFGVHRENRDLLVHHPDVVIIEFCVNDRGEEEATASFEGLVRKLLKANPGTAILALATMGDKGDNWQDYQLPVCRHYGLPMISYRDAIWPEIAAGNLTWASLSPDNVHPNDTGHAIIAGLISRYLDNTYASKNTIGDAVTTVPAPLTSNGYEHSMAYNAATLTPLSMGSWKKDTLTKGWMASKNGAPLTFKVTGGYISIMFKRSNKNTGATAYVLVDGSKRLLLDADFTNGWGDYIALEKLLREPGKKTHTLAFYYNDKRPGKEFLITDILVANY